MRWTRPRPLGIALVAAALLVPLAMACGADGDALEAREGNEMAVHRIELAEWAITGEDGGSIPAVRAGEVTFEVRNDGQIPHELAIIRTESDSADLPVSGAIADEEAAGEFIGRVPELPAGATESDTFSLELGSYALICNIAGHYQQGMFAQLTVE